MPISLFTPTFAIDECLAEIKQCLESGWTGLGFKTLEFEDAWRRYTGLKNAHFLNSASSGLHLALNIFKQTEDWKDDDEIITTPITFVATNHAILYERLRPVFADVDVTLCLDPTDVKRKITARTRAVMFVGVGGNSGQLLAIERLCQDYDLKLIVDAAHMAGARVNGETPNGDVAIFSFHAVKPLPTADAGMICFQSGELDALARKKAWHGIDRTTFDRAANNELGYRWRYDIEQLGFNYHGNSIMAAIALVQLRRLDLDNQRRRTICEWYDEGFADVDGIGTIETTPGCLSSRHLYQIHVGARDELIDFLCDRKIFPGVHYRDNRDYPLFRQKHDDCPTATRMSARILSLPLHLKLERENVNEVIANVRSGIREVG